VEFGGVGTGPNVTVGVLDFRLEIFPRLDKTLPDIDISSQVYPSLFLFLYPSLPLPLPLDFSDTRYFHV